MPHPNDLVLGKPWWAWVHDLARAMISGTTGFGLWKIHREGFLKFQAIAKAAFPNNSPFAPSASDVREIFDKVGRHLKRQFKKRPGLKAAYERMYDDRGQWDKHCAKSEPTPDSRIVVESAGHGMTVH